MCNSELRNVGEIPPPYSSIFDGYPCFNAVQSQVLDDILYTDDSVVVSAPTGAGKTAIFELAVVRLLIGYDNVDFLQQLKIVYICPIKSLCQERLIDWHKKFSKFGINCVSVTGDSENVDFQQLINHNLIISTPEKWDSLTRRWKDNEKMVKVVKLFMIDEVHLLNEENRGSTLEVIVSRMKTVENSVGSSVNESGICNQKIRFIALSATVPNVEDIAEWIGKPPNIKYYRFSEEMRPVKLKKIILGYNCNPKTTPPFKFDLSLNYKLQSLMMQYSEGKPTLIFCSTRKSVEMTANHIVRSLQIHLTREQINKLMEVANLITDAKAKETLKHGVGYHHAGLVPDTRHLIENLFRNGDLPILVTTSTLAMGVNLPAHLVIIKSTKCYNNCGFQDYTETAIHQMIGRAGRPQFDTSATALILTTNDDKHKFEQMVGCGQPIESNLHRHLTEHLNAEVVLRTITDLDVAMRWLASTFLYVRARKNPRHYGLNVGLSKEQIDKKLLEMCQIDLNKLVTAGMITMDQNIVITPTTTGQIMAKYCVAFETMKLFTQISGTEILIQILALISKCHEFSEMRLRVNDKKSLNLFNKNSKRATIRFPLNGRIKTWDMKVNCIIQAVLGNLDILDHSLLSESFTIMRNGARIAKCLIEYLGTRRTNCYSALLNTVILGKCFQAKLWEDSPYVCKQLSGIGNVASHQLVNSGKTTFQRILESNPRDIELTIKRKPPMGNLLIDEVRHIPRYKMTLEKVDNENQLKLTINLVNGADVEEKSTVNVKSVMTLLVGNNLNQILIYQKYQHSYMMENNELIKFIRINTDDLKEVNAHFISENWVGIDCTSSVTFEPSDKDAKKETVNNARDKDKKGPTYIQMFLDMYMKVKKKGTEVPQKKQKVKKDDTLQASKEITKDPKKLDKKTSTKTNPSMNEAKISKKANTNTTEEGEKSAEDSSAVATTKFTGVGNNRQTHSHDKNENVANGDICTCVDLKNCDCVTLEEISNSGSNTGTSKQGQCQKTNENVHVDLEDPEKVALDEISNASSASLYSDKPDATMDNKNVNRVHEVVESMEVDESEEKVQQGRSRWESDEYRLVIDEQPAEEPENVINFEEKVNAAPSCFHLSRKYNVPAHCKKKMFSAVGLPEYENALKKGDVRKRPALEEFKFPNKKKLNHQLDLENLPDSTDQTPYFPVTNALRPNNTKKFNTSNPASSRFEMKDSSQSEANKENVQKSLTWRSPLVYSPAAKFSPKISFPSCSTSKDEAETDVPNETENETFETTSSRSTANLTLNIQKTPSRQNKNTTRFINSQQSTKFPLRDKDYLSNEDIDDAYKMCSSSFIEMFGLDKVGTATSRLTKVEASPTLHYYSQLLAQPEQSQKQNTETASQRGSPNNKTYEENKENIPNDLEMSNAWDSSNASQNVSGDLDYADNYRQVNSQNAEAASRRDVLNATNAESSDNKQQAQQYFSDLLMYHRTLTLAKNTASGRGQNSGHQIQSNTSQDNEYLAGSVSNSNQWNSQSQWCGNPILTGNRQGMDYPYNVQAAQNTQAGFVPPNVMGDRNFTGHIPNSLPQLNETFVSHNYPAQYGTQNTHLPVTNVSEEHNTFSRLPAQYNHQHQNVPLPNPMEMNMATMVGDDLQRGRASEYFENNLREDNAHNQLISEFRNYLDTLPGSQQPSELVERTDVDKFVVRSPTGDASSTNVVKKPRRSATKREHSGQALQRLERGSTVSQTISQNFTQNGSNSDGSPQAGRSGGRKSRRNPAMPGGVHNCSTQDAVHNRSFADRPNGNGAQMLNRSLSFDQQSSCNRENFLQPGNNPAIPRDIHNRSTQDIFHHTSFANIPNNVVQMLNRSLSFDQQPNFNRENSFLQPPQHVGVKQQGPVNSQFVIRNQRYPQYWGFPQQNWYHPNMFAQRVPFPHFFNNGFNVPFVGQFPPYYPTSVNPNVPGIPDHDKQYMMNRFLQSLTQKKK